MPGFANLFLIVSISFAVTISASYTPCEFCFTRASREVLANMSLRLYPKETLKDYMTVPILKPQDLIDNIDFRKPTCLYIYGWSEKSNSTSVLTVLGAYLKRREHNVLLMDYSQISEQNYLYAFFSVEGIGYTLATALNKLVALGLDSSTLHIVGHSLGGQIAAYTGRYVNFKLPRITGLDPAGPGFDGIGKPLSIHDAEFVDVIHTDAKYWGSNMSTGHFNSFPNGGSRVQPGCRDFRIPYSADDFCDHHRSWYYYAESLEKEDAFIGVKCDSYDSFKQGFCSWNERVLVGFRTPTTAKGEVYFQTNSSSPYGRGLDGIYYEVQDFSTTSKFPFGR